MSKFQVGDQVVLKTTMKVNDRAYIAGTIHTVDATSRDGRGLYLAHSGPGGARPTFFPRDFEDEPFKGGEHYVVEQEGYILARAVFYDAAKQALRELAMAGNSTASILRVIDTQGFIVRPSVELIAH